MGSSPAAGRTMMGATRMACAVGTMVGADGRYTHAPSMTMVTQTAITIFIDGACVQRSPAPAACMQRHARDTLWGVREHRPAGSTSAHL
jgi:hypothetical protein